MPSSISLPAAVLTPDMQLLSRRPINTRVRYNAASQLGYHLNVDEDPRQLRRALALPSAFNPRTRQLAAQWRAQYRDDDALVRAALAHFNQEGFEYTLEPPLLGPNSVDDFLFTTKRGFCEHYASSFVFLMRAAGIPARVVTGYQGGEFNELGGYFVVRQYDAHAWAEVWLRGRGWVRVDPTAAIAPDRIQSGLNAALPDSTALPTQSPFLLKLRLNLDALTNQWNQWVLGYDSERQFAFLTRMGMEDITWQKLAINMLSGIALLVGIFTLVMLRRLAVEGAQDYAQRVAAARPELAAQINDLAARYVSLRYGGEAMKDGLPAFKDAARAFKL
jgi:hypothetical protein